MVDTKCRSRRRWTPSEVLDEIQKREDLSPKYNQQNCPSLYGAAIRHFGSWKEAVLAAGIDYGSVARRRVPGYWHRDRVILEIQALQERNSTAVRKRKRGLYSAALRIFGDWKEAIEAAGFDYDKIQKGWVAVDTANIRFKRK